MTSGRPATAAGQRLAALGRLAGGVAHDFNNVLMVINGYAEILAQSPGDDADARDAIEMILDAARRGGVVTQQLLLFGRRQPLAAADLDVAAAVDGMAPALRRELEAGIEVTVDAGAAPATARIDGDMLGHAVNHLVTHAREALPGGGVISVTVMTAARPAFVDAVGDAAPAGDYVGVAVADTGDGLDDDARLQIFEPFYSRAGYGKGAGLRLAAVYGIVKGSGGFIDVTATPGRGTTFTLWLPLAPAAAAGDTESGVSRPATAAPAAAAATAR